MPFFEFPEDAGWSADRDAVEFSVILRPYEGTVRIARRVFQRLLDQLPTPERWVEAFHFAADALRNDRRAKGPTATIDRRWQHRNHRTRSPGKDAARWPEDIGYRLAS
jgi:hypothetical protein